MIDVPQVMTVAGIDASGGAGANADLKTFHNQGVYAASIITGLTAQNTLGVQAVLPTSADFVTAQFDSVLADLSIQAVKTGALFDAERVQTVADNLAQAQIPFVVVDPVMVAKGGAPLLTDDAVAVLVAELLPLATVMTPNLAEASVLLDRPITSETAMVAAAHDLRALGPANVVLKGGHLADSRSDEVADYVALADGTGFWLRAPRVATNRTHGTGDTLSAYITAHLAKGEILAALMPDAKRFMTAAISETIAVGHGHGPLNHWVTG